ncbi:ATP-binding cassette domain-containing protein [Xanthomonas sp. WHRI 8391]|uniref:Choline transport ATP-binding protein OpuBA n=1 Tax=Xanthomonas hortorum pv. carotae TaxID=487904 RepID=A0A6V7BP11_9XANT|nr:ATP-binding cassette domain-containing protein [Xanthomonas hortorum]ETC89767.1 ABC transporter ATP-binding protein [Xanthomonas hortorum pv. carotae str. M081]MBG3851301.1 ATP-binding cassette domain-containing protein [Xanthomonas hortorum pv. carotae]UTS74161.1 ATP-binding cassette domain-containing protein [Xanthomonas hortorum]CAD0304000.1 Choline transport ATP-binding protein OpuBA [Xanthomonas hortorum pv. carotae]CAD0304004.1 Choline transport ATP-binding protein OpuBA [Xanthomonas 
MFTLDQVSRRYGQAIALDAVTLTFASGITTALIGPSGAGKSTVLRMLVGLEWPDSGTVAFDGTPLQRASLQAQRQRIGYVIQEGGLFPHLDARSNVVLLAQTLGWTRQRIDERLEILCTLCQLPPGLLKRYPAELSGGQRQRVGLIRALMLDPPALLLDEPLGALDPIVRYDLQAQMRELFAQLGKTVVLVTHDVAEAAYLADTLVLMRAGRVVQQGSARSLLEHPADPFVQRFLTAQRSIGEAA